MPVHMKDESMKFMCCGCAGKHSFVCWRCDACEKAAEVQQLQVPQGITYAEAAKKVFVKPSKSNTELISAESNKSRPCDGGSKAKKTC